MSRRIGVRGSIVGRHSTSGSYGWLLGLIVLIVAPLFLLFAPKPCDHEEVLRYYFSTDDSTVHNDVCGFCTKCDTRLTPYSLFQGELVDKSYLAALKEHSDGSEIIPGEYYTVTATVPLGYMGYEGTMGLACEVENEDFLIRFNAAFRGEFKEQISLIEEGQEITFRGRFNDTGCGFTDCELLSEVG